MTEIAVSTVRETGFWFAFREIASSLSLTEMNDFDADGPLENEWEEQGELAWNEFDWERYLREQDEAIRRYREIYEKLQGHNDRIDEAAHLMGWNDGEWGTEEADKSDEPEASAEDLPDESPDYEDLEPYTLHKNPVFIATKAIYLSIDRLWQPIATRPECAAQPLALAFQTSLHRGQEHAGLAIQALDLGDYAMAISLFKRALQELNGSLALADNVASSRHRAATDFRDEARSRLFDLREIWLRVINECRDELMRHIDEEN